MGGGPYRPLSDPNGEWLVWDAVRENVAEFGGCAFQGLTQREAMRFSTLMNDMVRPSTRKGVTSPVRPFFHMTHLGHVDPKVDMVIKLASTNSGGQNGENEGSVLCGNPCRRVVPDCTYYVGRGRFGEGLFQQPGWESGLSRLMLGTQKSAF